MSELLAKRIMEALRHEEQHSPISNAISQGPLEDVDENHPSGWEAYAYNMQWWGVAFGMAYALLERKPLEGLDSFALRACEVAEEAWELDKAEGEKFLGRDARERLKQLEAKATEGAAS
jgi:hypothetical protein